MADIRISGLAARPFLGGYTQDFQTVRLTEVTDIELVHVAIAKDEIERLTEKVRAESGLDWPAPGSFSTSERDDDSDLRIVWLAADQGMIMIPKSGETLLGTGRTGLADAIGDAGYLTGQTDNWVALRLAGTGSVPALERLCPLDLHETAMPPGTAARTVMEHLAVIILRESAEHFLLLSPSSSAGSFLHAVETSILNTGGNP